MIVLISFLRTVVVPELFTDFLTINEANVFELVKE